MPSVLRGMRTSALNFAFGTRLNFPHIGHPLHLFLHPVFLFLFFLITPSQICSLLQTKNRKKKKKKTWKKNSHFLPLKNKLNGKKKLKFFFFLCVYIYICFSNSRHNVYLYSNPSSLPGSVCEHGVTWAGLSAHTALHLSCVHFKHRYKEMCLFWLRERPPSRNQW